MGHWIIHFTNSLKNTDLFSNKTPLCCLDMCNGSNNHTITPVPPWATRSTTLTSANRSPTRRHTSPSAICPVQWKPVFIREENTELGYDDELQTRTCRWASLRRFLTVCAEILWLCKPIVAATVRVTGLRRSWRWRCWMWRSWAGVVTRGLRLWGRLDVLPNSLKRL